MGEVRKLLKPFVTGHALTDTIAKRIQQKAWKAFTRGEMSIEDIASGAGIGKATAERFIWGDSKYPRLETVLRIAEALGFTEAELLEEPTRKRA